MTANIPEARVWPPQSKSLTGGSDSSRSCSALSSTARHFPTLSGPVLRCRARSCPSIPARLCSALSSLVRSCPACMNYFQLSLCVLNALCKPKLYSFGQQSDNGKIMVPASYHTRLNEWRLQRQNCKNMSTQKWKVGRWLSLKNNNVTKYQTDF